MKTKKLCALVLSLMLVFSCFAVIPFTSITAAADSTPIYVAKLNYTTADSWTYMQTEIPLATGTYQFDVDYYKIGSVTQRVRIDANAGTTEISRTDDGSHITVQFSWVYDGSTAFNLQLRDNNFSGTGVLYFANPVLKEVSGGVTTGDNYVYDFYKQYTDVGATITTDYGWRGKWYRSNGSAAATFTVGTEGNSYFTPLATTATTKAVYIGQSPSGANKAATVFIPLTSKSSGSYALQDKCTVEFTCKVKVLSGTKPVVGFLRTTDYPTSSQYRTATPTNWVDNTTATLVGDTLTVRFKLDDIPADRNCYKSETRDYNGGKYSPNVTVGSGGIWGGLTIGNTAFNGNWNRQPDWTGSYIISEPSLKAVLDKDGNAVTGGEMLTGFDTYNNAGIYGFAGRQYVGAGTDAMNHPWRAPANKWSILGNDPDLVKFVTVDDSYTVASRTYVQHAETSNTREYYTCEDFDGVKFEKLGTGCYNVIPDDVNKKAVIIGNDGTNKLANIYLPLFTHRYFQCVGKSDGNYDWRDGYSSGTAGGNVFYHISFKAKRLSGNGQPTLGRLYAGDWCWNDSGFRVGTNAAYNGSGDATAQNSYCTSSYNATTGEFTAIVRFNKGYFYQLTQNGYNEVLTIGNAEHASSGYDTDNRDSSFAISDISIQVYDADNSTLLDAEAAPQMVVGNYWFDPSETEIDDHTSQHYYSESSKTDAGRPIALYNNMPLDTWGCDGSQAMISVVNRSDCLAANHTVYYHAPTATTMEYWSCTTCRKCYADPYASEEISDVSATQKMIVVEASGSTAANAYLPLAMTSSAGTHYYKFTCDMKVYGDEVPKINMLQGSYWGGNGAKMPDDTWAYNSDDPDGNGLYAAYDPDAGKYEAVIRIDHSSSTLAYSNALTGAYAGIMLGNGRHVGNGYTDTAYFTSFAFTNPELYELSDPTDTDSVIGGNLAAPVTDKTVNFGSAYSPLAAQRYNTEWTMYSANNLLAAPLGKWSIDYSRSWVKSADIPDGFFTDDGAENYMLHFGGTAGNYNYIVRQDFLKQGATYQFDIDYRETSSPARIAIEVAGASSYNVYSVSGGTLTESADNVPGAHKSVRFTVPVDARTSGDGNFRLSLGQSTTAGIQKSTNNVYFANATLRKVDDSDPTVLGENLLMNGSFQYGSTGGLTELNYENAITYWQSYTANNMPNILIPQTEELMTIPENFFEGGTRSGRYLPLDLPLSL